MLVEIDLSPFWTLDSFTPVDECYHASAWFTLHRLRMIPGLLICPRPIRWNRRSPLQEQYQKKRDGKKNQDEYWYQCQS